MEHRRQIQRQNRIPLLEGELLDGRGVLDARVVHQDVDAAHRGNGTSDHFPHGLATGKVGAIVRHPHTELGFQAGADAFDVLRIAEAVQHDVGTLPRQRGGNAQTDTAGGAGDYRDFSSGHEQDSMRHTRSILGLAKIRPVGPATAIQLHAAAEAPEQLMGEGR